MAAKKTHELIPFCHPLGLDNCTVAIELQDTDVVIDCICKVHHKTGVEMEALTGATVAALALAACHVIVYTDLQVSWTVKGSQSTSACSNTVWVAFSCLSGG